MTGFPSLSNRERRETSLCSQAHLKPWNGAFDVHKFVEGAQDTYYFCNTARRGSNSKEQLLPVRATQLESRGACQTNYSEEKQPISNSSF